MSETTHSERGARGSNEPPQSEAAARAGDVLRLVFGGQSRPWSFRLWDGSIVHCGEVPATSLVHFKSPEVFRQLFTKLDLLAFAEAYIHSELDFEGDVFDVMERSRRLQFDHVPWRTKLKIWSLARKV